MTSPPSMPTVTALRVGPTDPRDTMRRTARTAKREADAILAFCDADEAYERQHSLPLPELGRQHPWMSNPEVPA